MPIIPFSLHNSNQAFGKLQYIVEGLQREYKEKKVSIYADNMLLFLLDHLIGLQNVINLLDFSIFTISLFWVSLWVCLQARSFWIDCCGKFSLRKPIDFQLKLNVFLRKH